MEEAASQPSHTATSRTVHLLGTRGIPAQHGGFETFVARLAPYLKERSWRPVVYCQEEGTGPPYREDHEGIECQHVPVRGSGTSSTILFDWIALRQALSQPGLLLSFGYPTGVLSVLPRIRRRYHIINMDGIEWKRQQFGFHGRAWYYVNEHIAARLADHLIADHPAIAEHLQTRTDPERISTIPYGADPVDAAPLQPLQEIGVAPRDYALVVARPERDNSILEIVQAFSQTDCNYRLVVLGRLMPETNRYHRSIQEAASDRVLFPGPIYDRSKLDSLRFHARAYIHGHQVGGTNPSLVEALAAGNPVVAHDNRFNRWVAGRAATYFSNVRDLTTAFEEVLSCPGSLDKLRRHAKQERQRFRWSRVLAQYDTLLNVSQEIAQARQQP